MMRSKLVETPIDFGINNCFSVGKLGLSSIDKRNWTHPALLAPPHRDSRKAPWTSPFLSSSLIDTLDVASNASSYCSSVKSFNCTYSGRLYAATMSCSFSPLKA
ncbi:MAG: hypothetical protein MHMPM18_004535 [Marteilia pararefringens]